MIHIHIYVFENNNNNNIFIRTQQIQGLKRYKYPHTYISRQTKNETHEKYNLQNITHNLGKLTC